MALVEVDGITLRFYSFESRVCVSKRGTFFFSSRSFRLETRENENRTERGISGDGRDKGTQLARLEKWFARRLVET